MRIYNIRTEQDNENITLMADCKIRPVGTDTIYFKFAKKYQEYLCVDASPFAATLLVPAMFRGEDLVIEGNISKKLFSGMQVIMDTMVSWQIGMKRINIVVNKLTEECGESDKVGSFFSGGVDSFYTYLTHQKNSVDSISHLILIRGTDIELNNTRLWDATKENISKIANEGGVELVEVETNVQYLIEPLVSPDYSHGGTLAAVGLCLRNKFRKIFIPSSSHSSEPFMPWGSHPTIDKYWSAEKTSFEYHDFNINRVNKVINVVGNSPLAQKYLRVCYENLQGNYNCGKCEKCIRTMLNLYAARKLDEFKTFSPEINPIYVAKVIANSPFATLCHQENLDVMRERNIDPTMQKAIETGLLNVKPIKNSLSEQIFKGFVKFDHLYLRGILFRFWVNFCRNHFRKHFRSYAISGLVTKPIIDNDWLNNISLLL